MCVEVYYLLRYKLTSHTFAEGYCRQSLYVRMDKG